MLTQHTLPQTQTNPSSGHVNAQIEDDASFVTDTLNFAMTTTRRIGSYA